MILSLYQFLESGYLHLPSLSSLCSSQLDRPIESNIIDKNSVPVEKYWRKCILYIIIQKIKFLHFL